mmetsp:Transcript_1690/g.2408  ORF Transcript_1690/g.2408 Transcript_1690/m.2408 type:complete len:364 (-) Transcript_1690:51-1142(-)
MLISPVTSSHILQRSRTNVRRTIRLISSTSRVNDRGRTVHFSSQRDESSSSSSSSTVAICTTIGAGLTTLYCWTSSLDQRHYHTHAHNKSSEVTIFPSVTMSSLSWTTPTTLCQQSGGNAKKIPVRFGTSVRLFSSSSSKSTNGVIDLDHKEDCPICRKYSQGPCGEIFKEWLQCTDDHPGTDPTTKEDYHISKCHHLAMPLAKCLEKHQAFYDQLDAIEIENQHDGGDDDDDSMDELELQQAWENVIEELEEEHPKSMAFPSDIQPDLQLRVETNTGMAVFALCREKNEEDRPILCAYVKDQDGRLLAAGSREDLWDWRDGWGILRLAIRQETELVTAYAFYSGPGSNAMDYYAHTLKLPPR